MIKTDEKRIREYIKVNPKALKAFNRMREYYEIQDKLNFTNHLTLIERIYTSNKVYDNNIALSEYANLGDRSCYRYRLQYVECFYTCFSLVLN